MDKDAAGEEKKQKTYSQLRWERIKREQPEKYTELCAKHRKYNKEVRDRLRNEDPQRLKEKYRRGNEKVKHIPEKLLKDYKDGAKTRLLSFGIADQFAMMMFQDRCHYCHKTTTDVGRLMGIDRIDSKIGYEPGNVVPCCKRCNFAKGTMPYEEFLEMCQRVARFSQFVTA